MNALLAWYFVAVWGAGYVATKVGLQYAPPFTFLTLRFAFRRTAGSLMAGHARQGDCPERAKRVEGLVVTKRVGAVITSRASTQRIWRKRNLIGPNRT